MVRNDNASSRRRPCERDDTEPMESLLETAVDWLVCFMVQCLAVVENQAATSPPFVFVLLMVLWFIFVIRKDLPYDCGLRMIPFSPMRSDDNRRVAGAVDLPVFRIHYNQTNSFSN